MKGQLPKICYVVPSLSIGGTERQLILLLKALVNDFDFYVVCTGQEGALAGDVQRLCKVYALGCLGGWDPRVPRRLDKTLRMYHPDILHSFMFGFDYGVNRTARERGVRVVISSRRQLGTWKKPRHVKLQQKANALVDRIVANSNAAAEFAIEQEDADESLFDVIHNGFDVAPYQKPVDGSLLRRRFEIPSDAHVIGMVANFSSVKDHELFVRIAAELVKRRTDVHFLLVGTGPRREAIKRIVARAGLGEQVTFLATTAELPDLFQVMTVSVLCSHVEGLPNVVMESMAAGTPVVASRVGGIPEIIEDGVTGALIETRDPKTFANAIEGFLDDEELRGTVAQAGATRVAREFTIERMARAYRLVYAELLEEKRGAGA